MIFIFADGSYIPTYLPVVSIESVCHSICWGGVKFQTFHVSPFKSNIAFLSRIFKVNRNSYMTKIDCSGEETRFEQKKILRSAKNDK